MATLPAPYADGVLSSTNALLEKVGIQSHIESFKELTGSASSMFVAVFEKTFGVLLDPIIRKPVHVRDYVHNANVVIEALQDNVLHMPLPNINGEAIVRGDAAAILNLVSIFMKIVTSLEDARRTDAGDAGDVPMRPMRRRRKAGGKKGGSRKGGKKGGKRAALGRFPQRIDISPEDLQPTFPPAETEDLPSPPDEAPEMPPAPPDAEVALSADKLRDSLTSLALDYPRMWEGVKDAADQFVGAATVPGTLGGRPLTSGSVGMRPLGTNAGQGLEIKKLRTALKRMQREQDAVQRQRAMLEGKRMQAAARSKLHQRRAQNAQWKKHSEKLRLQLLSQQLRRQNHEHVKLRQLYRAVLRSARQMKRDEAADSSLRLRELEQKYKDLCESSANFFDDRIKLINDAGSRAEKARRVASGAQQALLQRLLDEAKMANENAVDERLEKLAIMEEENLRVMREVQATASALLNVDDFESTLDDRFLGVPSMAEVDSQMKSSRLSSDAKYRNAREKLRQRRLRQAYGA